MPAQLRQPCWIFELIVDEDMWRRLEDVGKVTLDAGLRIRLSGAINSYLENAAIDAAAVRPRHVRSQLSRAAAAFSKAEKSLATLLGPQPAEAAAALREIQRMSIIKPNTYAHRSSAKRLREELRLWAANATRALKNLPKDTGRAGNPYIGAFLVCAHSFHKAAGGPDECTSTTISFLRALCKIVGHSVQSDGALRKTLDKASKEVSLKSVA